MGALPFRIELPAGLATTIGTLPHLNPFDASRFVLDLLPRLPSAPTMPVFVDTAGEIDDDTATLHALGTFLDGLRGRVEPILLSLTGPVTIQLRLLADGVEADLASAISKNAVQARGQKLLDLAASRLPGAPVLLVLEEPALNNSMQPTFPLASDQIEKLVTEVVEPMSQDAMVGVQVNGRADWALLMRTGIGVLGAPVGAQLGSVVNELAAFLDMGGFVAWGAVPVDEPLGSSPERLWKRLSALWAELASLGLDPLLLRERSIITPAAGLGTFGIAQAERVLQLTAELSERVFNQVVGARLSIGA